MLRLMKLWIDDVRSAPRGYYWCKKTKEAINIIEYYIHNESWIDPIEILDMDHDAGDYAEFYGGDYINILNWMEQYYPNHCIPIHIHSMNPVGVQNMRAIIQRNGWKEVK